MDASNSYKGYQTLTDSLNARQDLIVDKLRGLAKEAGFSKRTHAEASVWKSATGKVTDILIKAAQSPEQNYVIKPDTDYTLDPCVAFGIQQAEGHKTRGVDPGLLLGLLKLWRKPYLEIAGECAASKSLADKYTDFIAKCFDRLEIGISLGWSAHGAGSEACQESGANRSLMGERKKLLTILNSLQTPVILLDQDNRLEIINAAGVAFLDRHRPGMELNSPHGPDSGDQEPGYPGPANTKVDELIGLDSTLALPWLKEEINSFSQSTQTPWIVEKSVGNGETRALCKVHFSRMSDSGEAHTGVMIILQDITSETLAEQELRTYRENLENLVEQRTRELARTNERLMSEIEDRRTALEALKESEYQYRMIVETSSEGIWTIDREGITTFVNDQMAHMLGYSPEEMLGGSFTDFMDPSWKEKSLPMWNRRMAGVVEQHDFKFRRKDGEDLWALLSASPMVDQNGEFMGALAMVTDITERREMEDRLRNNLQFLEILVNTIPSPVFYKDINGVYLGCNKAFADLMGVSHENIVGKTVYQVAPEDMAAIYAQKDEQLLATGGVQIYEGQTRDHFGHYHEVIFYKSTFPDQHGNLAGIIGIALDITERKQTEKALEDSNRTLQTTLSTIPIGIGLARNRRIVWVNQSYIDLFGFEFMDECRDLHASTLYKNPEDYERVGELYDKLSDGAPREIDIQWLKKDGSTFQGHLAMKALSASDPLEGVIFAITDISWRKRAEELILQSERLKAIGELATGVAHNFNNLLQIMVGGAQIALTELASGDENAAIINLEQILESAKMGSETVKRLQDFARIRTEDVNLKGDLFNLSKTVESAIEMSKPWWKTSPEKEGFSIELVKKLTPEAYIRGNENEIFEVVVNLIKNASEALPQGGVIKITLSMIKDKVRLMVEDNGVGIGEEEKAHLFQPFWTTKGYSGTGMGLATCYGIVKRHKGEIDVQSAQDLGASFIVTLPASEKPASSKTAINVKDPGIKLNVLVIDDMPAVLKQLDRGLSKLGQTVFTARSGAEGIEIVKETLVDLVVCDLGMPGMNGIRVASEIKSLFERRKAKRPHLIILTGWGGQIHRTEAKAENGVDLILEKPIGSDQLLQKVKEIMADGPLLPPK